MFRPQGDDGGTPLLYGSSLRKSSKYLEKLSHSVSKSSVHEWVRKVDGWLNFDPRGTTRVLHNNRGRDTVEV